MFTDTLQGYVGDTIKCEVDGYTCVATYHHDPSHEPPWETGDGNGIVSEWTTRPKKPGEQVLSQDGGHCRYFDWSGTVERAKREQWDAEPFGTGTKAQRAVRATEAEFKRLQAWCRDEWFYGGVAVTVCKAGVPLTNPYDHVRWGIESNSGEYLTQVANELLDEALDAARQQAAKLALALRA